MALTDKNPGNIGELDFSSIQKSRFRIDGDNDRIIELNLSDMNMRTRLAEEMEVLHNLVQKYSKSDDAEESLKEVDQQMRESLNRLFQDDVASACAPSGTLLDPINGKLRYEYIIETLLKLYSDKLSDEYSKIQDRLKKYAATKKKSNKK